MSKDQFFLDYVDQGGPRLYENDKSRYFLGAQAEFRSSMATEAPLKI